MEFNEFIAQNNTILANDIDDATLQANYEDMMASVVMSDEQKPKKRKTPRSEMTQQELAHHRELDRLRKRISRSKLSEEQMQRERDRNKEGKRRRRNNMSEEAKQALREKDRIRRQKQRLAQRGICFPEGDATGFPHNANDIPHPTQNAKQLATAYVKDTFKNGRMVSEAGKQTSEQAESNFERDVLDANDKNDTDLASLTL